ncbi:MAG: hypothetical protein Q8936_11895 [Bacillota bacterium]|nr:hypothetical protein [Bacillota bacterium]
MILYPPVHFDGNEWFIIISTLIMWAVVFLLPKRFSFLTMLMIWLFNIYISQVIDFIIGKPPLLLYYVNDIVEYEYFDALIYLVSYFPTPYFFVYYLDKWRPKGWWFGGYILSWSLLTTGFEWITLRFFHVFTWTGWSSLYSFFSYIIIFILNVVVLRFVQRQQKTIIINDNKP